MNAYRQAALLITQLDRNAADELLDRMPAEQSQAIRDQVLRLEELNDSECGEAIDCFLNRDADFVELEICEADSLDAAPAENSGDSPPSTTCEASSLSTADCRVLSDHTPSPNAQQFGVSTPCANSLEELLQHSDAAIAGVIQHERSSVIAAVLRNAPQKKAANVLRLLDPSLQTRVLSHLHVGQQIAAETVEIIADCLCDELAHGLESNGDRIDALLGIFQELPEAEQVLMLQSLRRDNPVLAQRLVTAVAEDRERPCAAHD